MNELQFAALSHAAELPSNTIHADYSTTMELVALGYATMPGGSSQSQMTRAGRIALHEAKMDEAHKMASAQNEGYDAYNEHRPGAPTLSPFIRDMIKDLPVGKGASAIFNTFLDGFNMAADEAAARILAED